LQKAANLIFNIFSHFQLTVAKLADEVDKCITQLWNILWILNQR